MFASVFDFEPIIRKSESTTPEHCRATIDKAVLQWQNQQTINLLKLTPEIGIHPRSTRVVSRPNSTHNTYIIYFSFFL